MINKEEKWTNAKTSQCNSLLTYTTCSAVFTTTAKRWRGSWGTMGETFFFSLKFSLWFILHLQSLFAPVSQSAESKGSWGRQFGRQKLSSIYCPPLHAIQSSLAFSRHPCLESLDSSENGLHGRRWLKQHPVLGAVMVSFMCNLGYSPQLFSQTLTEMLLWTYFVGVIQVCKFTLRKEDFPR